MNHISKYNEIFGIFKKKKKDVSTVPVPKIPIEEESKKELDKNSLWLINPKMELIEPTKMPENAGLVKFHIYKYYVEIYSTFKGKFNLENLSKLEFRKPPPMLHEGGNSGPRKALWVKDSPYNRSGKMVRISDNLRYIKEGGKLFDAKDHFKNLKEISNELGYKVGEKVYIKEYDVSAKIEEILV